MVQGLFSGPAWVFAFVALCLLVARLTIDEGLMPFHLSSRAQASSAVQLDRLQGSYKACFDPPANHNSTRANAAFVILAREDDLSGIMDSIASLEHRFNRHFHYPYVFLNDGAFSQKFIDATSAVVSSNASYGRIAKQEWEEPEWIDPSKAAAVRKTAQYMYGDSQSYRRMCRYQSGFFFQHPLVRNLDFYWRVEPNVQFCCDIDEDPFLFMQRNNKLYGWNIALPELMDTIPSLWRTTKDFLDEHPQYLARNNALDFISDDSGQTYNSCHFWSNFEIASTRLWQSEAYQAYFSALDRAGGFAYERWGDAPVHTIAASLFLNKHQIHHFDYGYQHDDKRQCPQDALQRGCSCLPDQSISRGVNECFDRYQKRIGL